MYHNKLLKTIILVFLLSFNLGFIYSQDFLSSTYADYLRICDLAGIIQNNSKNYYTYQLLRQDFIEKSNNSIWDNNYTEKMREKNALLNIEPAFYHLSYNSSYPHGFNDNSLWQGRGINGMFNFGVSSKFKGLILYIKPNFSVSENKDFEIMQADGSFTSDYAYFIRNIDLPQRFGNDLFTTVSWGQSEINYKYNSFTAGFGYQNIWLGPSTQNPILFSNNADEFPKIHFSYQDYCRYFGLIDLNLFWGKLTESDYFNDISSDDSNLISGLMITLSPKFIPGFTVGLNRVKLSPWENNTITDIISIFDFESDSKYGRDSADQRASITCEWKYRESGFRGYFEWARNDYSPSLRDNILLEPSHSQAYTIGIEQILIREKKHLISINAEITQLIHTRDYEIGLGMSQTGFYTHSIIKQGYTNKGQLLGAGIGPGAESQYFGVHYIFNRGSALLFFRRLSRNKDFIYGDPERSVGDLLKLNIELTGGLRIFYMLSEKVHLETELDVSNNINRNYIENNDVFNIYLKVGVIQFF